MPAERVLRFDACLNVRDLGGLPLRGGGLTRFGAFVRADGLFRLSEDGLRAVRDYGVDTVIDLRFPDELQRRPNPFEERADLGVRLVHISLMDVTNEEILAVDRAQLPWLKWNKAMLQLAGPQIGMILRTLARSGPGAALYHCHAGKDRTGLVSVLLEGLAGVEDDAIAADYVATNVFLRDVYAEILAEYAPDSPEHVRLSAEMPCKPVTALGTLHFLREQYGGPEGYMKSVGVDATDIAALRRKLTGDGDGR